MSQSVIHDPSVRCADTSPSFAWGGKPGRPHLSTRMRGSIMASATSDSSVPTTVRNE